MLKQLTCIRCPIGCQLDITVENNVVTKVEGNECRRGLDYAEHEILNPVRGVSTTVLLKNGEIPVLPVKTSVDVSKADIFKVMAVAKVAIAQAPITVGDVIKSNIAGTGADLIATRTVAAIEE